MSAQIKVDQETGEILPMTIMERVEKAPAIVIDISEVSTYHSEPEKLIEKIRQQASYAVFDVSTKSGKDACRSHAAAIIKCITPAINASKALAADAQKVIKADLYFRKTFESGVRDIAEFHRRPLTEIEEAEKRIEEERAAQAQYQKDWEWALEFNELDTLRKEKAAAEAKAKLEQDEKDRIAYEERIRDQARIDAENAAQQRIEQAEREKLEAEKRAEQAAINERNRLDAIARKEAEEAAIKAANIEHRKQVNNDILSAMIVYGIDESISKKVITGAAKGLFGALKINY